MSFNARVSYTANGNTGTFAITFSFIDRTHVKVFLDGVSTTAFSVSGSNVVMNSNPANGVVVLHITYSNCNQNSVLQVRLGHLNCLVHLCCCGVTIVCGFSWNAALHLCNSRH